MEKHSISVRKQDLQQEEMLRLDLGKMLTICQK